MLYVFYITTTPYLPCNINRKELYDFYYTAITLTTGYKICDIYAIGFLIQKSATLVLLLEFDSR